jgi:hypothetical protein
MLSNKKVILQTQGEIQLLGSLGSSPTRPDNPPPGERTDKYAKSN